MMRHPHAVARALGSNVSGRNVVAPHPGDRRVRHSLQRETFRTSRLLDFCTERELVKQIGHPVDQWPLVVLKELTDNALDEAEESGTAPVISVQVKGNEIVIADDGSGMPPETVADILDFSVRVSSREAYCSPTRGAQGNALKTVVAMAFALDGTEGETLIESRGTAHRIGFRVDQIRQEPKIDHIRERSSVRNGTRITVRWPVCACSKLDQAKAHFLQMAEDFGWLNPHLSLSVTWDGKRCVDFKATDPAWAKWTPSDPTSPHWYDEARLRRLMGAYIARDQDHGRDPRTVREFISEFRGLSGSAKQKLVLEEVGAARLSLPEFFGNGDRINNDRIANLLAAMQRQSSASETGGPRLHRQGSSRRPVQSGRCRSGHVQASARSRRERRHSGGDRGRVRLVP